MYFTMSDGKLILYTMAMVYVNVNGEWAPFNFSVRKRKLFSFCSQH